MQRLVVALFVALDVVLDVAARCTAGTGATPAAFYLGLCRLRGILSLPTSHDNAAGGQILSWRRLLQAGYSSMRQRKLESDAESAVATTVAGGLFSDAATKIGIGREHR